MQLCMKLLMLNVHSYLFIRIKLSNFSKLTLAPPYFSLPSYPFGRDIHAVAVLREGKVVGHISYNQAPTAELFLRREVNKGFVEVNGARVNGLA